MTAAQENAAAQQQAAAVDHAAVLAPFLTDDTFAVAYVDLSAIDPPALVTKFTPTLKLPPPVTQQATLGAAMAKGVLDSLRQAGVTRVYLVVGLGDVEHFTGPLLVAPAKDARSFEALRTMLQGFQVIGRPAADPAAEVRLERHAGGAAMLGAKSTLDRYAVLPSKPRPDLVDPLGRATASGAAAAGVLAPDADSRRVIRELWPALPAPYEKLTGELIADRLKDMSAAVNLAPEASARLTLETADEEAAATSAQLIKQAQQQAQQLAAQIPDPEAAQLLGALSRSLETQIDGTRVAVRLSADQAIANAAALVADAVERARTSAQRRDRMQNFKQLMIALLSYESARRTLPPAAIRDAQGRPLLSWRVAVLPYLDQKALYDQFHLDEPWDSPHNRELVKRMPAVFTTSDPKLAAANLEGKTVYQVPVGPDTIFFKDEGTKLSEITDGTSATIALVEVVPDRAVEWTKPADWEVNLQDPLNGVRRADRDGFIAARCDGSVAYYKINAGEWRALFDLRGERSRAAVIDPAVREAICHHPDQNGWAKCNSPQLPLTIRDHINAQQQVRHRVGRYAVPDVFGAVHQPGDQAEPHGRGQQLGRVH